METTSVFDRLVEELSRDERRRLLAQIGDRVMLSVEPLRSEPAREAAAGADSEIAFQSLSSFVRFLFKLKGLFSGKSGLEAYEESLLAHIKKDVSRQAPGLADFRHALFLDRMKTELEDLKESADFFLRFILPPSERIRSEFIAFLARCHAEPLMQRLEVETDPRTIIAEKEIASESDIKAEMDQRFHALLDELGEEDRKSLYLDCQALDYLKQFCDIDFESLLGRFTLNQSKGGYICSFSEIGKRLLSLTDVLKSARLPPTKTALQALFLYRAQKETSQDPALEEYLTREFAAAEAALARIRAFNQAVPLELLAKVLAGDANYQPTGLKGGENWFVLFKKYWAARLNALYRSYVHTLRTTSVVEKAFALFGVRRFEEIKYYHPSYYDPKLAVAHWRSLSCLLAFYKNLFVPKLQKPLQALFLHGEFYKTENRLAFADTFNFLSTLNEKLLIFEKRLAPTGELGKPMEEARNEKLPPAQVLQKLEPLLKKADVEALSLVEQTVEALQLLNKILNGILYSEAGGKFDTLSNLGYIGGKENEILKKDWEKIISLSFEASAVLKELSNVEAPG